MAYHAKKRRTRARKHTLRSRRRTRRRGGDTYLPVDVASVLSFIYKEFTDQGRHNVQLTNDDKIIHKDFIQKVIDNKDRYISIIGQSGKNQKDKDYSIGLIEQVARKKGIRSHTNNKTFTPPDNTIVWGPYSTARAYGTYPPEMN